MKQKNMSDAVRWVLFNKVFLMIVLLIAFFAYMDSVNLQGMFALDGAYQADHGWSEENNVWSIYWTQIQPAIIGLWYGILFIIATIWYLVTKDKSEALALLLVPAIFIMFATQDLLYFVFSPQDMGAIGCWAEEIVPVSLISDVMGETCPTQTSFFISGFFGLFLGLFVLLKLKYWQGKKTGGRKK